MFQKSQNLIKKYSTNDQKILQKEITKLVGEAGKIRKKLSNEEFLAQAPSHVIEKQRERLLEAEQSRHKLEEAVGRLSSV